VYQGNAREGEVEVETPGAQRVRAAEAAGSHARRPTCLDIITLIGAEHRNKSMMARGTCLERGCDEIRVEEHDVTDDLTS
jgi:hypothetical protein